MYKKTVFYCTYDNEDRSRNYKRNVTNNAVSLVFIAASIMCLINLGFTTAFNITVSLFPLALLSTYLISIERVVLGRIQKQEM